MIVAIATVGSNNAKTGNMVQIWILPENQAPHDAVKSGEDESVCGDCVHRGTSCYVKVFQAPLSVWKRYKAGGYESDENRAVVERAIVSGTPIRFGAYGDPLAVPLEVWENLLAYQRAATGIEKRNHTGYTHAWRRSHAKKYRHLFMASCDNLNQANQARRKGWRFFLIKPEGDRGIPIRTVECLADSREMTCADCRICDGSGRGKDRASVWITIHGVNKSKFNLPVLR